MANYDYKEGKKRVLEILDNKIEIKKQDDIPDEKYFTFDNGFYGWVTAIFVDIRDSTTLFSEGDKEKMAKIIRSFTSEIIDILNNDKNKREIGIRGDCVYAIYTTPTPADIYELSFKTIYVNTYMKMLNKLLKQKKLPTISVGIGMATAQELVVKAGRKHSGINNQVWIGNAVTKASKLSSIGNKNGLGPIVFSEASYINFVNEYNKKHSKDIKEHFTEYKYNNEKIYGSGNNLLITDFNTWVENGMK